ncbi:MAG: glycosyltransferase [Bacteroidales bacterium]|nr:glycosyltransferase [Bacteroidales bacterium]
MSLIKALIKKITQFLGYNISITKINQADKPIFNFFKTCYPKRVLISYITAPFRNNLTYGHTNYIECLEAAKIFNKLGYQVDIIDWNKKYKEIDFAEYEVIYGFGEALHNCFYFNIKQTLKIIHYGTGSYSYFQNAESLKRVYNLYKRKGIFIPESARLVENLYSNQIFFANALIIVGNKHTLTTYPKPYTQHKLYEIPIFFHKVFDIDITKKDFSKAKFNFLWFGGEGLIHKGLDILLELFKKRKDINLHICGAISYEKRVENLYYDYLYNTENIKTYGFINIKSEMFQSILNICGTCIFSSASEGSAPSVVTVMGNGGLIPIINEACGIDIPENTGFIIKNSELSTIETAINQLLLLKEEELRIRSKKIIDFISSEHSLENYSNNLYKYIKLSTE